MSIDVTTPARHAAPFTLPVARDERSRRYRWLLPALLVTTALLVVVSVLFGIGNMLSPRAAWQAIAHPESAPLLHTIAVTTRFPRAVLALITGVCMGTAGALLQAITRNALASPEITGVTEGAVAAVLTFLAFGPSVANGLGVLLPLLAVAGGLATAAIVMALTRRAGKMESTRFIMIGILFGGILSSLSSGALIFLGAEVESILAWLSGSLVLKTWRDVGFALAYVAPGLLLMASAVARANTLQLGDDVARSLGQRRELDRFLVLVVCVIVTAGVVAIVGAIGFVGLIGPHMVRKPVGSDLRRLVPASALAGAIMMLVADMLARNADARLLLWPFRDQISTAELPVGIYLTLFGLPFLMILLMKRRAGG